MEIIRNELRRKVKTGIISTGSMSDPYNPLEKKLLLTRHGLELVSAHGFGIAIATKSALVTRDIDVLREIKEYSPAVVKITITTSQDELCAKLEPHISPSSQRFAALKDLAEAGIFCGVLMMPLLPYITDNEENIGGILRCAKAAGASFVYPSFGLTLRAGNREYFYAKLDENFPGLKEKYARRYGSRYECNSPRAKELWQFFKAECENLGLLWNMKHIVRTLNAPYEQEQLRF